MQKVSLNDEEGREVSQKCDLAWLGGEGGLDPPNKDGTICELPLYSMNKPVKYLRSKKIT